MDSLEQCIAKSMDCRNIEIIPYLPYILQDFWEIGSSSETIKEIVEHQFLKYEYQMLQTVDLGCGKGAVSIKLTSDLKCHCLGIDANKEFIHEARIKAKELHIDSLCLFEVNDIRKRIKELAMFDVIILGSIGPVFGNYYKTLLSLSPILRDGGRIIIADGYIKDSNSFVSPYMLTRKTLIKQIQDAGMQLINEVIDNDIIEQEKGYDKEFNYLEKRCRELIIKQPKKAKLFEEFIKKQNEEYNVLKNKVICATLIIKRY